ncbi:acyl transferase/acyl hydrolase/lysophospholipase [Scheffersomyces xylosifermentans]|uniref:acyl transferase/acyl hydrolase/lysophospholipase n=1 Tax=Scheffersomyces xylosifermentans TaxID=1304137 RepID=UPI00315D066D
MIIQLVLVIVLLTEFSIAYSGIWKNESSKFTRNSSLTYITNDRLLKANGSWFGTSAQYSWNLSYSPYTVLCPSTSLIREANNELCAEEKNYVYERNKITSDAILELLSRNSLPGFNHKRFLSSQERPIKIAIAISGGGYRSMLIGAGMLSAFDIRNPASAKVLGGVLQASTYIGGISGGSWLVMSNLVNDFKPILSLDTFKMWDVEHQLLEGVPNFDPKTFQDKIQIQSSDGDCSKISQLESSKEYESTSFFKSLFNIFKKSSTNSDKAAAIKNQGVTKKTNKEDKEANSMIDKFLKSIFIKGTNSTNKTPIQKGSDQDSIKRVFEYYKELQIEVRDKRKAGFHISLTDYWGRALARRIFTNSARTPGATMTASTKLESFKSFQQPFPIICTVEKDPRFIESNLDSHLYEFTPYEFGSWDSYLRAFIPIKFLGTKLTNGKSTLRIGNSNMSKCISGFDNVGFLTGTSSSLFNHIFVYVYQLLMNIKSDTSLAIEKILKPFGLSSEFNSLVDPQLHPDYALYSPNPFYGYTNRENRGRSVSENKHLYLVDGGDDGQNIPFQPFLVSAREVDLIIALDVTADMFNYPNGTTLKRIKERYHNNASTIELPSFTLPERQEPKRGGYNFTGATTVKYAFPKVPTREQMIAQHLNERPIFLGCDLYDDYPDMTHNGDFRNFTTTTNSSQNSTRPASDPFFSKNDFLPPLIVFYSNGNYGYNANTSTFQLSYTKEETAAMIANGYNVATYSNSAYYAVCFSCAVLKRAFDRSNLNRSTPSQISHLPSPSICRRCFNDFCWKG